MGELRLFTGLYERAAAIQSARNQAEAEMQKKEIVNRENYRKTILSQFESAFADYLEMLRAEQITYEVCFNDERYYNDGTYIHFKRGDEQAKMDFHNATAYRYEYAYKTHCSYTLGAWDKDDFVVWIAEQFPQKIVEIKATGGGEAYCNAIHKLEAERGLLTKKTDMFQSDVGDINRRKTQLKMYLDGNAPNICLANSAILFAAAYFKGWENLIKYCQQKQEMFESPMTGFEMVNLVEMLMEDEDL